MGDSLCQYWKNATDSHVSRSVGSTVAFTWTYFDPKVVAKNLTGGLNKAWSLIASRSERLIINSNYNIQAFIFMKRLPLRAGRLIIAFLRP
jgi:hypothetical protein